MKKYWSIQLYIFLLLLFVSTTEVRAGEYTKTPYEGYNYNAWGESIPISNGSTPDTVVNGNMLGVSNLSTPQDMFMRDGTLYILDSGNNRVIVTDVSFENTTVIERFMLNGEESPLNKPNGIFVTADKHILIADTENERIVECDENGFIIRELLRPTTDVFPTNIAFRPTKIIVDSANNVYALIQGFFYGAATYDQNGRFTSFYGANKVQVTPQVVADKFWKSIMSQQQISYTSRYVPTEYSNFDIDDENFIYTVTKQTTLSSDQIKKLNNIGKNILNADQGYDKLNKSMFGDRQRLMYKGNYIATSFVDIDISEGGLINALDTVNGRVFQYDQESNLLFVFGGSGNQDGTFLQAVAIESHGQNIYVLDAKKGSITVFKETSFGQKVHEAVSLYADGFYDKALEPWNDVLKMNANYEIAYRGIGKALMQQQKYEDALSYLKLGYDRESYSNAYRYVRADAVKNAFPFIGTCGALLIIYILSKEKIKALITAKYGKKEKIKSTDNPVYVMMHPFDGYDSIYRTKRTWVFLLSLLVVALWFIATVIERQQTGFIFNFNKPQTLSLPLLFIRTFGVMLLFTVCNWAVGTLLNGNGTMKRIWIVCSYGILPYVLAILAQAILSNFVLYDEGAFLSILVAVGIAWSAFMILTGLKAVHEYTLKQTISNVVLTIIAIMFAMFLFVLFGSLLQELFSFFMGIFDEMSFRLL